jgi:hypothetical protein
MLPLRMELAITLTKVEVSSIRIPNAAFSAQHTYLLENSQIGVRAMARIRGCRPDV